jgi:hypothetical protein
VFCVTTWLHVFPNHALGLHFFPPFPLQYQDKGLSTASLGQHRAYQNLSPGIHGTYNLALSPPPPLALVTNSQQISAHGFISSPTFFASELLACRTAYRLAIP